MAALKSDNPTRADINKHFVIRYQNVGEKGTKLIGAGKYSALVGEGIKIKHFKTVLGGGLGKYTFKIRNRLKIEFHSK